MTKKEKLQVAINKTTGTTDYEILDETIDCLTKAFKSLFGYSPNGRIESFFISWSVEAILK